MRSRAAAVRHPRRIARVGLQMFRGMHPRLWTALMLNNMLPPFCLAHVRLAILRLGGVRLGARAMVGGSLHVAGGAAPSRALTIGEDCFVNEGCWFDTSAPITLDHDVYLAHEVAIVTSSHEIGPRSRRAHGDIAAPVVIGAGTWIGARATILPGVTIGSGVVVGAGSVVTRSIPDDVLAAGVPARVIRQLDADGDPKAGASG